MADSFIIFVPNPPSICTLTSSGKQSTMSQITKNLEKLLENYKKNDYYNQEMNLFEFIDKPFNEVSNSHFLKIIKKLIDKIKDDIKDSYLKLEPLNFSSSDIFNLTYKNIFSLANIIMYIIDNIQSKGKLYDLIYNFSFIGQIPKFKDTYMPNQVLLSKLLKQLETVQTVKICLYNEKEEMYLNKNKNKRNSNKLDFNDIDFKMDTKIILLFSLFFKAIFKSVNTATVDLNIPPIDAYFTSNINPYLINEQQILNLANYYTDIFIGNLILIKSLPNFSLTNLNLIMYDSYQIELHNILTILLSNFGNEFDFSKFKPRSKTVNKHIEPKTNRYNSDYMDDTNLLYSSKFNNNYLYIQHLLASKNNKIFEFVLDFNSLDPLLFNSVNYLLTKYDKLAKLKLIFFPHRNINKRKIYLNNYFYNKYSYIDEQYSNLYSMDDKKIYYQYIDQNENNNINNNYILEEEKLLNELFYSFNNNLRNLSIILEKQITELFELKIDFGTYNNKSISLYNYDNYNCSIICFIFDLFKALQVQADNCKINSLTIFYEDFLDEKSFIVETIKKKLPSYRNGFKLNELKLNYINFNLSNISLFLPFENFPSASLTELILSNLTYNDLNNLVSALKTDKNIFPLLIKLDISLSIMVEDYSIPLETLIRECLSQELIYFNITLPFNISIHQFIDILSWIKSNHNDDTNIYIKIVNSQLSPRINHHYFKNCVIEILNSNKQYFRKRNLLLDFEVLNKKNIKFNINKYDVKNLEYYYKIIYCFNKNRNEVDSRKEQKIFENIFNYIGGFKKYEVEIEVIN